MARGGHAGEWRKRQPCSLPCVLLFLSCNRYAHRITRKTAGAHRAHTELTARGATQAQYLSRSMRDPELIDIKPAKWRPRWRSATSRFCLVGSCLFGSEKGRSWGSWLLVTVCGCGRLVVVVPGRGEDGPCDWYDEQKGEQQQRPPNLRAHLHRERQPPMHGRDPRDGLRRHRVAHWQRCRLGG